MEVKFKILRFNPREDQEPHYQEYTIQAQSHERILDCLNRIKWEQDGSLAFRMSCAHGVCGSDGMRINGRCGLACQQLVKDYTAGETIVLEPLPHFKVIKDLVVDMEGFMAKLESVRPYLINALTPPEHERRQLPEDSSKLDEVIRCILCACCTGACPVLEENPAFLGPAALIRAFRHIFDSRDQATSERLQALDHPDGAWACQNHFECTHACPKEILITKNINVIKREIKARLAGGSG